MKKLTVISIKQNCIKNKYVKIENRKNIILSLCLSVLIFLSCFALVLTNNISQFSSTFSKVFNPINPLYNNMEDVIFTGGFGNLNLNKDVKLIVPIKCNNVLVSNGEIKFTIDSNIMIISPEDGIISEIGVLLNGEKFIEIKHSKNIVTRFENIDITGVVANQVVLKGKDIATAKVGETVRLIVYESGQQINNLKIVKNVITWEN